MGTSSTFGGQAGASPLVPSWLEDYDAPNADPSTEGVPPATNIHKPEYPPIRPLADSNRFTVARRNFSHFAGSGGIDSRSLGRAVSHYVGSSVGGARKAAVRMGSARHSGSLLLEFLSDVTSRGVTAALSHLNLSALAGRPIEEIFLGLADHVCPDGGSVDEGIARAAFIETITELAGAGVTNLDELTADQMVTVFELYVTNAIEARLCNDIGAKLISLPSDGRTAERVQAQLHDFIRRGVADAVVKCGIASAALIHDQVSQLVNEVYVAAFEVLRVMGQIEAERK